MITEVDIDLLHISAFSPTRIIPEITKAQLLIARKFGINDPVIVRPIHGKRPTHYEILGRAISWKLAQELGFSTVGVVIHDINDEKAKQFIRYYTDEKLDAISEAHEINNILASKPGHSSSGLAKEQKPSRSAISHRRRLLKLPARIREMVESKQLCLSHARILVSVPEPSQLKLAHKIVKEKISVRAVARLVRELYNKNPLFSSDSAHSPIPDHTLSSETRSKTISTKDPDTLRMERSIGMQLGCRCEFSAGRLLINFDNNLEVLDGLLDRIGIYSTQIGCKSVISGKYLVIDFKNDLGTLGELIGHIGIMEG